MREREILIKCEAQDWLFSSPFQRTWVQSQAELGSAAPSPSLKRPENPIDFFRFSRPCLQLHLFSASSSSFVGSSTFWPFMLRLTNSEKPRSSTTPLTARPSTTTTLKVTVMKPAYVPMMQSMWQ